MITNIENYMYDEFGGMKELEKCNNLKRKALSHTSSLKRYSNMLTYGILSCIFLISVYPIVNMFFTGSFELEFNFLIVELSEICNTRAQINSEIAISLYISRQLYNGFPVSDKLISYLSDTNEANKLHIQNLYGIPKHF